MRVVFAANIPPGVTTAQSDGLASARYRAFIPAAALRRAGQQVEVVSVFDLFRPDFDDAIDLLVLHQPKTEIVPFMKVISIFLDRLERIRNRGGIVALDVSDFKFTPEFHARLTKESGAETAEQYRLILDVIFARSSVITAPTESLAELLRRALRDKLPVFVIDDVVEVEKSTPQFAPGDRLNLLWFGRMSAHSDAMQAFLQHDLPRIDAIRPVQMHLVCEPLRAAPNGILPVQSSGKAYRVTVTPWSLLTMQQALEECDIVVLPFEADSMLSRGKSNNRALQALYAGRYTVAHPIDSYLPLGDYIGLDPDLMQAVATALADPATALARLQRGQAHVADYYSPTAIGRRWLDLAGQLLQPVAG